MSKKTDDAITKINEIEQAIADILRATTRNDFSVGCEKVPILLELVREYKKTNALQLDDGGYGKILFPLNCVVGTYAKGNRLAIEYNKDEKNKRSLEERGSYDCHPRNWDEKDLFDQYYHIREYMTLGMNWLDNLRKEKQKERSGGREN